MAAAASVLLIVPKISTKTCLASARCPHSWPVQPVVTSKPVLTSRNSQCSSFHRVPLSTKVHPNFLPNLRIVRLNNRCSRSRCPHHHHSEQEWQWLTLRAKLTTVSLICSAPVNMTTNVRATTHPWNLSKGRTKFLIITSRRGHHFLALTRIK